jgi:hypothetical protein
MARFSEYVDSNYLPGEIRSAGLSDYQLSPQDKTEYMAKKLFKFQPGSKMKPVNCFNVFLLCKKIRKFCLSSAPMPNTPFGNLASYMS